MRVEPFDTTRHMAFTRRATVMSGGVLALFGGVVFRLYDLQVRRHHEFRALADDNQFNQRLIVPLRGEIYDRYGATVATNEQDFRVLVIPERTDNLRETLIKLATREAGPHSRDARRRC
ncbi:MAG: hypothetical protein AAF788_02315 [Pseudomonadota bacterium]